MKWCKTPKTGKTSQISRKVSAIDSIWCLFKFQLVGEKQSHLQQSLWGKMFLIVSFLLVWLCYRFANIIFTLSSATTIFQCDRSSLFSQFNICFFIVFVCFFISCFFLFANKSIGRRKQEWCFFIFIDCSVLFCDLICSLSEKKTQIEQST